MAANDPSFDVATPRGVLQGVAVFNWDGSQWQPAGRAATEVATPTGVLRGVAAFTGGPNWSPNTRAQTEVPTPSGVLDGVAVYTWSGSQWVPPSGNIETATPSGVLEGVAAFDWDGTNWQPQAQAGAEVPTPYGVLTGVARFGWTGSAWAATGAPTLSLDFMQPGTLDPRITFTRASSATYTDASGVIQTAATNAPRWDYANGVLRGLLIEEQRTNLAQNSATLVGAGWTLNGATITPASGTAPDGTNSMNLFKEDASNSFHFNQILVTLPASTLSTLSVHAKAAQVRYLTLTMDDAASSGGSATFDLQNGIISAPLTVTGSAAAGVARISPVGGGVYRCSITNSIGAATGGRCLLLTSNSGTPGTPFPSYPGNPANGLLVWGEQVEQGAFPTSYIPTTSVSVTRAADVATMPTNVSWYGPTVGTFAAEFILNGNWVNGFPRVLGDSATSSAFIYLDSGLHLGAFDGGTVSATTNIIPAFGVVSKGASVTPTGAGTSKYALNGGPVASHAMTTGIGASLTFKFMGDSNPLDTANGYIRRVQYWPRALPNAELQQVTT